MERTTDTAVGSAQDRGDGRIEVRDVSVTFGSGEGAVHALRNVSLTVPEGHSTGLVGESGSGKSTLAKVLTGIYGITSGEVLVGGQVIRPDTRRLKRDPRRLQMIPQDPYSSLSPRRTTGQTIAEALSPGRPSVRRHRDRILSWLDRVELPADAIDKYPYEFSGGQRQRIAIARALCLEPRIVIADEITSALDLSVQAEILELLAHLREELRFTMIFISHNLAVVKHVSDDVVVLYHGEVVEEGPVDRVFSDPTQDYTRRLLDSVPGRPGFSLDRSARRTQEAGA